MGFISCIIDMRLLVNPQNYLRHAAVGVWVEQRDPLAAFFVLTNELSKVEFSFLNSLFN